MANIIERIKGVSTFKQKEYIIAENKAYDELIKNGYTPQGADDDFKSVCVMKFEHPEFWEHPVKCGKCEVFHFKSWQEAADVLADKKHNFIRKKVNK